MGRGGQMRKEDPTHAAKIFGSKLRLFSVKAFNAKNDEAEKKKKNRRTTDLHSRHSLLVQALKSKNVLPNMCYIRQRSLNRVNGKH